MTLALFILGFFLISKGADVFINSTVDIAKRANISEIVLGATVVSFATTLPELTVSTLASIEGHTTMSLGNAIGSIICNTGLVLGLVGFISPFKIDKKSFLSKSILLLIATFTLMILAFDKNISLFDGIILLIIGLFYMNSNFKSVSNEKQCGNNYPINKEKNFWAKNILAFIIGLVMMVFGSRFLVNNGIKIAQFFNIPQGIISLTVIALGTSLPELVSSLTAIKKNCHAICVGNIIGANILNIVSVIGISSVINDIPVLSQSLKVDFPFISILLLTLILPSLKTNKISKIQGFMLLSTYFLYLGTIFVMYN